MAFKKEYVRIITMGNQWCKGTAFISSVQGVSTKVGTLTFVYTIPTLLMQTKKNKKR
jgi:hypothetical protein